MFVIVIGLLLDLMVLRKSVVALAGVFFGLVVGLLIGYMFNHLVELVYLTYNIDPTSDLFVAKSGIKWLINMLCCYLAVSVIMQTKDDFRFIIPYVEFSKQTKGACPLLLDTSAIIDGRIVDIAATGVLSGAMIVPKFILNELQQVADSQDRLKRIRGRRGLDMLTKMQNDKNLDIQVQDVELKGSEADEPVDHKLVTAAKKLGGKIVTTDFNLNKVAGIGGVEVFNINDLSNALRPIFLPGEAMHVKLVKPGDQSDQGVGYLPDGTMVVVEDGRRQLGRDIRVVVTSVLQTSAGRMIFGRTDQSSDGPSSRDNDSARNGNY